MFSLRVIQGIKERFGADAILFTTVAGGSDWARAVLRFNPLMMFETFFLVRAQAKRSDVIHAFDVFPYGIVAVLASWGLEKKIVITAIGSGSILPFYRPLLAIVARWCIRRADRVIAISKFTRDEILKKIPDLSIRVINPGINWSEFEHSAKNPFSKDVLEMQPYIISVGTIRWRKGYKRSIRAFAEVARRFPELKYVIIGKRHSESFFQELQKLITELNLQGKILFFDSIETREELLGMYRGAELFCLFSENVNHDVEGFGIVFLEAAACGLAVVGVKNCGVEDAVEDGKNGILIGSRDPNDFADAICEILNDKEKKERMKKNSLAMAQEFEWEKKIGEYEDVYQMLAKA